MTTFSPVFELESLELRRFLAVDLVSDAVGLYATESVIVDGTAYFFADNGQSGRELWRSDGTAAGTALVKDLTPGAGGTKLIAMFEVGGRAVIVTIADQVIEGGYARANYIVWSSDGTAEGTTAIASFTSAAEVKSKQVGDQLALFVYRRSSVGSGNLNDGLLYFTDGTAGGTRMVKTFLAGVTPHGDEYTVGASRLYAAGNRLILPMGDEAIWSSDGTAAGTIDLTAMMHPARVPSYFGVLSNIVEVGGKVIVPDAENRALWVTDGTVAGTVHRDFHVEGRLEFHNAAVAGGKYYFLTVRSADDGRQIRKTLYALDLESGALAAVYEPAGDASDNRIALTPAGDDVLFVDENSEDQTAALFTTDGTSAGTVKLAAFSGFPLIMTQVAVDGVVYFAVATGGFDPGFEVEQTGVAGWVGERGPGGNPARMRIINQGSPTRIELWRSDGTVAGTAAVRLLWEGDAGGKRVMTTLTAATGKLVVRTDVETGVTPATAWSFASLTPIFDETIVYDPRELSIGRAGASARLVNGVLRIGGSLDDDAIRVWRSVRTPDRLVVEYNGNFRSFPFSDVTKIIVDLQAGDDRFEILEAEGGAIRARTSVLGGDGTDTILTGTGRDTIIGGAGGDLIRTRGNAD
ncbi:MAG: hypothetical protein WBD40_18920, partial [Tepidisphaeraceae bacterium]